MPPTFLEDCGLSLSLSAISRVATVGDPDDDVLGDARCIKVRDPVDRVAVAMLELGSPP